MPAEMLENDPDAVLTGADNLRKQIENIRVHGVTPVVGINAFPNDHPDEYDAIRAVAGELGVRVEVCTHFADGGAGAIGLAEAVLEVASDGSDFAMLYPDSAGLREKLEAVATRIYGAGGVLYSDRAGDALDWCEHHGYGQLPVCIAKTHLSISSDPALAGAPTGWTLPVRDVRLCAGAGFVYALAGDIRTMPGLPAHPAAADIDLDEGGEVHGLF
jgi:formate--tetrahydrofolate ligase